MSIKSKTVAISGVVYLAAPKPEFTNLKFTNTGSSLLFLGNFSEISYRNSAGNIIYRAGGEIAWLQNFTVINPGSVFSYPGESAIFKYYFNGYDRIANPEFHLYSVGSTGELTLSAEFTKEPPQSNYWD